MSFERVSQQKLDEKVGAVDTKIGDLSTLSTTEKSTVVGAVNELFTSVGNGKAAVASAITDKGVTTASDATFATMAQNIAAIPTGSTPTGTININTNGTYDVTDKASAVVAVPSGSANSRCFLKTLSADASGTQVEMNPDGDAAIAAHKSDSSFTVGVIALGITSSASFRCAVVGNNSLHSAITVYGVYLRSSPSGVAGMYMTAPVNSSPDNSPGNVTVDSNGVVRVFASSAYPLKAGSYICVCGW